MQILLDDLTNEQTIALINLHTNSMMEHSPAESIHALPIEQLKNAAISLYSAWEEDELLGCGALKHISTQHAELKSMRTAEKHLRKGVAKALLIHLVELAKSRGYAQVSLETGTAPAFLPARKLYEAFGFTYCEPFDHYVEDSNSTFMTIIF